MFKSIALVFLLLFGVPSFAVEISRALQQSTDRIVKADLAEKQNAPFICLECGNELILRKGKILAPHFAHKSDPNSTCTGGGPETWEHRLAKELIADHLDRWKFAERCPSCEKRVQTPTFSTAEGFEAKIEYPFDRFYVDVMVLRGGLNEVAIEVRHTHPVDDVKHEFFSESGLPIIEVDASQIIRAHETGTFRVGYTKVGSCAECEEQERRKNSRPCLQCGQWQNKNDLYEIEAPAGHKFRSAFVCEDCREVCPTCEETITREQRERHNGCRSCSELQQTVQQIIRNNRIDLTVPFSDKDAAKACGARWDSASKTWYVELRNMRRCATWIRASKSVIPMIEATLRGNSQPVKRQREPEPKKVIEKKEGSSLKRQVRPESAVAADVEKRKADREAQEAARLQREEQDRIAQMERERELALEKQREADRLRVAMEKQQAELEERKKQQEVQRLIQEQEAQQRDQERVERLRMQREFERQRTEREEETKRRRKAEERAEMTKDNKKITDFFGRK